MFTRNNWFRLEHILGLMTRNSKKDLIYTSAHLRLEIGILYKFKSNSRNPASSE